jgi:hypothetical protein
MFTVGVKSRGVSPFTEQTVRMGSPLDKTSNGVILLDCGITVNYFLDFSSTAGPGVTPTPGRTFGENEIAIFVWAPLPLPRYV